MYINRKIFLKRRFMRGVISVYPLITGLLWGIFFVHCIAGMENFCKGVALLSLAFGAGTLFRRLPGIAIGKMGCWYIACVGFLRFNWFLPAAFFFGTMDKPGGRRNYGGRLFAGLTAGVLLGYCCDFALPALMSAGAVYFLFSHYRLRCRGWKQKLAVWLFNVAVLGFSAFMVFQPENFVKYNPESENSGMERITRLSSFGLCETTAGDILLIARQCPNPQLPAEFVLLEKISILPPGKFIPGQYELIIVEDVSAAVSAAPHRLSAALKPGGILVIPRRFCRNFPDARWYTLPGCGGELYAAARINSRRGLEVSADNIEKNLLKLTGTGSEQENILLPGAVSGALIDFRSEMVAITYPVPPERRPHLLIGGVILIILLEIILHNRKIRDLYCSAISAAVFAMICGILPGNNEIPALFDGDWLLALLAVGAFFVNLPFKIPVLRIFSLLSGVLLWLWWFYPGWYTAIPAMFFSALCFAGSKRYFQVETGGPCRNEAWIALSFAGGFALSGCFGDMGISVLAAICVLKLWLLLRS